MSDNKNAKSGCKKEKMQGFNMTLKEIDELLEGAGTQAEELLPKFEESYEGEAKETMEVFLENLPKHIGKLRILYQKLDEFIYVTAASFLSNDTAMKKKMEE